MSKPEYCWARNCNNPVPKRGNLCFEHMEPVKNAGRRAEDKVETSGGHVDYYSVEIKRPNKAGRAPYIAECQDIIEALGLDFNQGELLKSVWRLGAQIKLGKQKAGDTPLRNAEKCEYYGHRTAEVERSKTQDGLTKEQVLFQAEAEMRAAEAIHHHPA